MVSSRRREFVRTRFLVAITLLIALAPAARAQKKPDKVSFETVDEVTLSGVYYPSEKGDKAVTVLLLHRVGGSSQAWEGLAAKLQQKGYAVLRFDFRGHGDSTDVTPAFWKVVSNQKLIKGANPKKQEINCKDFSFTYLPMLANDVTAARRFLDLKNDERQCNTTNLFVIAEQDGATLGALWLADQWRKGRSQKADPKITPPGLMGQDVAAAVWLSITPTLGGPKGQAATVDKWISPLRDKTPMAFLYGDEDKSATKYATDLCENVLKASTPPRLKLTATLKVKTKAAGVEMLAKDEDMDQVLNYLANVLKERDEQAHAWLDRNTKKAKFDFIHLPNYGFKLP